MKILTLEPVRHDGEDIEIGTELELTKAQAVALIEAGAARKMDQSAASTSAKNAANKASK